MTGPLGERVKTPKGRIQGSWGEKARCVKTLSHPGEVLCLKIFGERLRGHARLVTGTNNGALSYYDLHTGERLKHIKNAHRGKLTCIDVDTHYIVTGGTDHLVNVWSTVCCVVLLSFLALPFRSFIHYASLRARARVFFFLSVT